MQVPSNLLMNKIGRPGAYLSICMTIWVSLFDELHCALWLTRRFHQGILCACSGIARSYGGLLATRFLLGIVEAAFYPGMYGHL